MEDGSVTAGIRFLIIFLFLVAMIGFILALPINGVAQVVGIMMIFIVVVILLYYSWR